MALILNPISERVMPDAANPFIKYVVAPYKDANKCSAKSMQRYSYTYIYTSLNSAKSVLSYIYMYI